MWHSGTGDVTTGLVNHYQSILRKIHVSISFSDPDMLKKGTVQRPSMSQFLPTSWPHSDRHHTASTGSMSAYSTCSSEEGEVFSSSSESDEAETDESAQIEEEGESKLALSECTS